MKQILVFVTFAIALQLVSAASAQQGGGFGGGAMLGGAGGGAIQSGEESSQTPESLPGRFPDLTNRDYELNNAFETRSLLLTPGDKVEIKFNAKSGQTLFATAQSQAFDSALEILDSKGKKLAENDDQNEGNQSPYIAHFFTKDGD